MTETLTEFLEKPRYARPQERTVAGYLAGGEFRYCESTNPMLPAAIAMLTHPSVPKRADIYSNLPKNHWLRTYTSRTLHQAGRTSGESQKHRTAGATEITPVLVDLTPVMPNLMPLPDPGPLPTGGFYTAASDLYGQVPERPGSLGQAHRRALRYYMLAAYAMLDLCGEFAYEALGNYVAALMIDDTGRILSVGVNTGYFRHAEVSLLYSYFSRNPDQTKLPAKTIVFSTLTPCAQCTGYLNAAKREDTLIYFGQEDPGTSGRKGWEIAQQLALTASVPKVHATQEDLHELNKIASFSETASGNPVVVSPGHGGIHKVRMATGLQHCTAQPGNVAGQIGSSAPARRLLEGATRALENKMARDRTGDPHAAIKVPVLRYLIRTLVNLDVI